MRINRAIIARIPITTHCLLFFIALKVAKKPFRLNSMPNFVYFLFKLEAKGLPLPSFKPAVMGKRREFEIAFVALKPGMHEFTFEVDDKFFADVETRDFSNCHAFIKLHL